MATDLDIKLQKIKKSGKKLFIPYLTAGYPSISMTEKLIYELDSSGADLIELGIPFSDPLADGPTIQYASEVALKKGATLSKVFELVKKARKKTSVPIVFMTYYNPIYSYGIERFITTARKNGVDGLIIPDIPPEEAEELIRVSKKNNMALIFLFSPTSSEKRVELISKKSTGFIYYVSITGVTGVRNKISNTIKKDVKRSHKYSNKPVAAGFGISTPKQASEAAKLADGVIVGSALIKEISANEEKGSGQIIEHVGRLAKRLSKAVHSV